MWSSVLSTFNLPLFTSPPYQSAHTSACLALHVPCAAASELGRSLPKAAILPVRPAGSHHRICPSLTTLSSLHAGALSMCAVCQACRMFPLTRSCATVPRVIMLPPCKPTHLHSSPSHCVPELTACAATWAAHLETSCCRVMFICMQIASPCLVLNCTACQSHS